MISFDEAIELVRSIATPLGTEMVPLARAAGRVLARPVVAQIDSPRSDVSSMDGYAVRDADLVDFPISLHVEGQSVPGAAWSDPVSPGSCVRIFTGAPVPAAADRVVIQEDVRRDGPLAIIDREPEGGRNIRRRGSDFRCGEELLAAAQFLGPRALVAAAAADTAELEVCRRPRLCILSTGDELAEPGSARQHPDAIPDSVSLGVAALAEQWGGECIGRNGLRDDLASMQKAAEAAIDATDLVVVTGGASVGERDFAKAMFDPVGLELLFSKVSMKPGKPAWLGRVREKIVIGLPGNPTSAMVTARLLLAPLLAGMTGLPLERALHWRKVQLSSSVEQCGARETFHRARSVDGKAEILPFQDSGAQKTLAEANLLVRQAANSPALDSGAEIDALDF
jgi:molybdopterin molybdotransferase